MIQSIQIKNYTQNFSVSIHNKIQFGEVNTPFSIIHQMLDMIPKKYLENPHIQWVDPACGCGYFPMILYKRLMNSLQKVIPSDTIRSQHILEKMLIMIELNPQHHHSLTTLFGTNASIYIQDFCTWVPSSTIHPTIYIGNPPYNSNGIKKVPTNTTHNKRKDGNTIWTNFIHHAVHCMKQGDYMLFLVPSIWMKPDKAGIYNLLTNYKLHKIRTYTNTETARLFKQKAQTPICMFLMEKKKNDFIVSLYNKFQTCYEPYQYSYGEPIPLCGSTIVAKLRPYVKKYGTLQVKKTNMPRKHITISTQPTEIHPYKNVRTCRLHNTQPILIYEYSNKPCAFYGEKKLILAHKMYGFPYFDVSGTFGISNRDNYIIYGYTDAEFKIIQTFLSTKTALYLFETTRYRMKYLEKYVFEFIPNIANIPDFPTTINDKTIAEFFGFTEIEQKMIRQKLTKSNFPTL